MKLIEYLELSSEEQWDELWDEGQHVQNYVSVDFKYSLYSLHNFYVEVELCPISNSIIGMFPCQQGKRLEKYIPSKFLQF
ncbi:hypothetical protein FK220_012465 [Flavobacteriaceae bacterium TP-CH-4]|uniref:Uncharacterized protein n=1 Tax=Pelagihabitans pacificus TaxID=2696054 RepID=A0A967AW25_9FLAO|nr:hypothetical protein [Pelagihabitans pacificus]NHF60163.1 hypothetical protein [Pelagihabitans pacificus]